MITHVVLFRLKERTGAAVEEALSLLRGLEGRVESLRGLRVGRDITHAGRSYDIALIAGFEDLQGLEAYRVHPLHRAAAERLGRMSESIVAVDFEES